MNDQYLSYQTEDFITDDAFVAWVLKGEKNAEWTDWVSRNEQVAKHVHRARQFVLTMKFKTEPDDLQAKKRVWAHIEERTAGHVVDMKPYRKYLRFIISTAAAAMLALIIYVNLPSTIQISHDGPEPLITTLPSQSTVELIGETTLSYHKKKWESERRITLVGEAIFDVTKGVPFIVDTDNGNVRVLGTKFRVVSREKTFYVVVESGRVEVSSGSDTEVLTANQNFVRTVGTPDESTVDIVLPESTQTSYYFQRETLDHVFEIIKRTYGVDIVHDLDQSMQYTGLFRSTDDLIQVLDALSYTMGLTYEIEGSTVTLTDE